MTDERFMALALAQARAAMAQGEVPVGAVLVHEGQLIAAASNAAIGQHDPSAHAEIIAMRAAAQHLKNYRLDDCVLYVTLEPCAMCAGAMLHARLKRVVFGAAEPKTGAAGSVIDLFANPQLNHQTQVEGGVMAAQCSELMQTFFKEKREQNKAETCPVREDALRTPESRFALVPATPWASHYLTDLPSLRGLRLHFLDAGPPDAEQTTFCLHGNTQWGYAFHRAMPDWLAAGQRVVVPDLVGFGKSDKPKKESFHTLEWHVQSVLELIERLALKPLVLIAQKSNATLARALVQAAPSQFIRYQLLPEAPLSEQDAIACDAPFPDRGHRAAPRAFNS